jgi:hypothetical protein
MSKFSLNQLSEGIRQRHVGSQNRRLVEKWSRTGLLRGLDGVNRENMATLLENQASDMLIRESSSIGGGGGSGAASGDLRGFTNVAFPIVRRVFGGLVANELVSIQPMSLPAGLLFYLDYTYGSTEQYGTAGNNSGASVYAAGQSIYNNPAGKGVRSGSLGVGGQYDLAGTGFTKLHKSGSVTIAANASGTFGTGTTLSAGQLVATGTDGRFLQFDPQITNLIEAGGTTGRFYFGVFPVPADMDTTMVREFALSKGNGATATGEAAVLPETVQGGTNIVNVRRLNQLGTLSGGAFTPDPFGGTHVLTVISGTLGSVATPTLNALYPIADYVLGVGNRR